MSPPSTHLLSANAYLAPPEQAPASFARQAALAGFGGIGWTQAALRAVGAAELRRISDGEGLAVTSLNSAGYFTWQDATRRAQQDETNLQLVEDAALLGAAHLVVITGGIDGGLDAGPSRRSLADARNAVKCGLNALDARAASVGVRLGLEPIHPADHLRKGCVNSIADALTLSRDLEATDLVVDTYHSCWDPDLPDLWSVAGGRIGAIQLCNWYEPAPDQKPSRDLPADGRLDVGRFVETVIADGYRGAFEFEMFDVHRRDRPVEELLQAAHRQISAFLATSDVTEAASAGA